jgi:hypothetical protein
MVQAILKGVAIPMAAVAAFLLAVAALVFQASANVPQHPSLRHRQGARNATITPRRQSIVAIADEANIKKRAASVARFFVGVGRSL